MSRCIGSLLFCLLVGCSSTAEPDPSSDASSGWRVVEERSSDALGIIVISLDTLRADKLGAYGNSDGLTPNLDRFARESIVFEHAYAQSNETLFSHASLFTGRYPSELGPVDYQFEFPEETHTLAGVLGRYDYQTAAVVGGGHMAPIFGLDRGFSEGNYESPREWGSLFHTRRAAQRWLDQRDLNQSYFLFLHGYDTHHRYLKPGPWGELEFDPDYRGIGRKIVRHVVGTTQVVDEVWYSGKHLPEILELDALRMRTDSGHMLRAKSEEGSPLFQDDLDHLIQAYDGAVRYADTQFGLFMVELQNRGILDQAIIVVLSDHGEELGEYGVFDHRPFLSPEVQHVPLMIRLPGARSGGRTVGQTTALIDLMPTLLDAAGAAPIPDLPGVSWWAHIEDNDSVPIDGRRVVYSEGAYRLLAATDGTNGVVFSGLSVHSPYLTEGLNKAANPGPAWHPWDGTSEADAQILAQDIRQWRSTLTPAPGAPSMLSEEKQRLLREGGYWSRP